MSITAPRGFIATGVSAGLKSSGAPDLALVQNLGPRAAAAAVFTANRVYAAPVAWSKEVIADGHLSAVVLNSGGANACTGQAGYADAAATADAVGAALGVIADDVGVASTGLIGVRLPMPVLFAGVRQAAAALSPEGGADAARAIMTTDTVAKEAVRVGRGWTIGGMAKGAGMLAPGLATMLVVVTTDVDLDAGALDRSLRAVTAMTFDRVDADGCLSTNDTVFLMASGASGIVPSEQEFTAALREVCAELAAKLIADAEGAHHEISVKVVGAATEADAIEVGRAVARNNLFKCAIFGNDPNWGRVLAAIGTTSAVFEPGDLDVSFNGVQVCLAGQIGVDRKLVDLSNRQVEVLIDLHAGDQQATILTTDLTYEYVKENAEYSS